MLTYIHAVPTAELIAPLKFLHFLYFFTLILEMETQSHLLIGSMGGMSTEFTCNCDLLSKIGHC